MLQAAIRVAERIRKLVIPAISIVVGRAERGGASAPKSKQPFAMQGKLIDILDF